MTSVLACPTCITRPELRRLDPHLNKVPLQRCDTCLGLLADKDTVTMAVRHYHESHYVMVEGHGRHRCRACGQLFDAARGACPVCREAQWIECTQCKEKMKLVHIAGVTLDVCWNCRIVWFDRGELGLLARRHPAELKERLSAPPATGAAGAAVITAPDVLADAALSPEGVLFGADAAAHAASAAIEVAPELVVGAGEIAVNTGEAAIEISGAAADVLLSIVGDIFS